MGTAQQVNGRIKRGLYRNSMVLGTQIAGETLEVITAEIFPGIFQALLGYKDSLGQIFIDFFSERNIFFRTPFQI